MRTPDRHHAHPEAPPPVETRRAVSCIDRACTRRHRALLTVHTGRVTAADGSQQGDRRRLGYGAAAGATSSGPVPCPTGAAPRGAAEAPGAEVPRGGTGVSTPRRSSSARMRAISACVASSSCCCRYSRRSHSCRSPTVSEIAASRISKRRHLVVAAVLEVGAEQEVVLQRLHVLREAERAERRPPGRVLEAVRDAARVRGDAVEGRGRLLELVRRREERRVDAVVVEEARDRALPVVDAEEEVV